MTGSFQLLGTHIVSGNVESESRILKNGERPILLKEAAPFFPPGPNGQPVTERSILRYMDPRRKGVRLEFFKCGGRRYTSAEAIQRFIAQETAACFERAERPSEPKLASRSQREAEKAGAALSAMGI